MNKSTNLPLAAYAVIALLGCSASARPLIPSPERQLEYAIVGAMEISSMAWDKQDFKAACVVYGHLAAMLDQAAKHDADIFRRLGSKDTEVLLVETYSRKAAACDVAPFQRRKAINAL